MDGRTNRHGWMDGVKDGWMDGRIKNRKSKIIWIYHNLSMDFRWTNRHANTKSREMCKSKQNRLTQDRYNLLRFKAWNTPEECFWKVVSKSCGALYTGKQTIQTYASWCGVKGSLFTQGFLVVWRKSANPLTQVCLHRKYRPRIGKVLRRLRNHNDSFQILRLGTLIPALFSSEPFHVKTTQCTTSRTVRVLRTAFPAWVQAWGLQGRDETTFYDDELPAMCWNTLIPTLILWENANRFMIDGSENLLSVAQRTDLLHVPLHNLHWSNLLQVASLENMFVAQYESPMEASLMSYIISSMSLREPRQLCYYWKYCGNQKFVAGLYTVNMCIMWCFSGSSSRYD